MLLLLVFAGGEVIQEIESTDDLGPDIDIVNTPGGGVTLIGDERETVIKLTANEDDFAEFDVFRELKRGVVVRDCLIFKEDTHWYGGPEQKRQQVRNYFFFFN